MKAKIINVNVTLHKNKLWLEMELIDENGWNFIQYFNSIYDVLKFFKVNKVNDLLNTEVETIDRDTYLVPFGFKNKNEVLLNNNYER